MCETNLMHGWASLVGSLATIAIILTALGIMLGIVKPADALKYGGVIAGIVIVSVLIVSVFVGLWSCMSLWQRAILVAIGFGCGGCDRNGISHGRKKKRNKAPARKPGQNAIQGGHSEQRSRPTRNRQRDRNRSSKSR